MPRDRGTALVGRDVCTAARAVVHISLQDAPTKLSGLQSMGRGPLSGDSPVDAASAAAAQASWSSRTAETFVQPPGSLCTSGAKRRLRWRNHLSGFSVRRCTMNPFNYQGPVAPARLINRRDELDALQRAAADRVAIRLAAPRRFGKTSLIDAHVAAMRAVGHRAVQPTYFG